LIEIFYQSSYIGRLIPIIGALYSSIIAMLERPMNIHAKFDLLDPRTDLLIGGAWGGASNGKTFATLDPATGETIAEVAEAGAADIDAAVAAARRALKQGA
jgi:hypothetical protein